MKISALFCEGRLSGPYTNIMMAYTPQAGGYFRTIRDAERMDTMIYPHGMRNALRIPVLMISTYTQCLIKM